MYCLDSSVIIAILSKRGQYERIVNFLWGKDFCVTALSVHEVLYGMRSYEKFQTTSFFEKIRVFSFNKGSAEYSSIIRRTLKKQGSMVAIMDILIAAICIENNLHLVTCDKDFVKIPGLKLHLIE